MMLKWFCCCNDFMLFRPQGRTNVPRSHPGLSFWIPNFITSISWLKHVVRQYFRILSSSFWISSYFLRKTVLKPEIEAKTANFWALRRIEDWRFIHIHAPPTHTHTQRRGYEQINKQIQYNANDCQQINPPWLSTHSHMYMYKNIIWLEKKQTWLTSANSETL